MSDFLEQHHPAESLKREHDSTDDFEHLEHELHHQQSNNQQQPPLLDLSGDFDKSSPPLEPHNLHDGLGTRVSHHDLLDTSIPASNSVECDLKPVPATPPPSANFEKYEGGAPLQHQGADDETAPFGSTALSGHQQHSLPQHKDELEAQIRAQLSDAKAATMAFMETEKSPYGIAKDFEVRTNDFEENFTKAAPKDDHDDDYERSADNDSEDDNTEPERSEPSEIRAVPPAVPAHATDNKDKNLLDDDDDMFIKDEFSSSVKEREPPSSLYGYGKDDFMSEIKSSTLPEPEKSPELDFVKDEIIVHEATREKPVKPQDDLWNVLEKSGNDKFEEKEMLHDEPPTKPLPPLPKGAEQELLFDDFETKNKGHDKYEMSNDFLMAESKMKGQQSGGETGDSEFESEPEPSPCKSAPKSVPSRPELGDAAERKVYCQKPVKNSELDEIAPREIWKNIGIDAWFNPERLNPKVAALIYWRDPKKSGIVFGATLGVLLSLAYFSLISVLAYISLLTLTFTVAFRIYKTVLQAIQKTSDGHPFKDILDLELTLPTEKVHEVADIAVANANAALGELRRLFLVEDFVDSLKFGVILWSLTYLGSWFNGMTLIIIGVVALFSLPKVYETNKTQIDQNLALVQAKINEITAKVKAAMPLGKKAEPTKEE